MLLNSSVPQFPPEKIRNQSPRVIRQAGIVTFTVGHSETVPGAVEEVPIERLTVGLETRHQFLLHRNTGDVIVGAEEDLRWTFEVFHRVVGMARSQLAWFFVADGRIIADERARVRSCGHEVD